ncbi:class I SAM-dependent methyltransferase [Micromonospora endophytica]|uniref:Methyltransferase type 11 n=1 Tax=Micromonospora endophytica TaxID=515350 RepID=A0A2W2D8H0_9ACTN|nr:class I SAM-dependent methyltransferase [Micromonospora endophytica]PZF97019.1 methyltransferase type 11 [Micromonospora endophytica]RIW41208.1 class I SAM-dependent methyltransferase [Micromonospora endophytica]
MFDNTTDEAAHQLRHLGDILDPGTRRTLFELGIGPGWTVTDIGAGAGTLTTWLADQVAPGGGHVTAVDLDPRHITASSTVTVRAGDIRDMELEGSQQAIVARLVLMHLPEREQVLTQVVQALAPGGVLVVADWDCTWRDMIRASPSPRATALIERFQDALLSFGESRGADMGWAKRAPEAMLRAGLVDVDSRIESRSWRGGTGICLLHRSNSIQREAQLLDAGMTREELTELRQVLMDPELMLSGYLMHTTVGRRPTTA